MAYQLGQFSGGATESSSALRILNVGIRNSLALLTDDAFTQANPCDTSLGATTISALLDTTKVGVLSGSVAFTRPDAGSDGQYVGGPGSNTTQAAIAADYSQLLGYRPVGLFINSANGNPFENQPGVASGIGPFVCGGGTYGTSLYETQAVGACTGITAGDDLIYTIGMPLVASRNGLLMPGLLDTGAAAFPVDRFTTAFTAEQVARGITAITSEANVYTNISTGAGATTVVGVLRIAPDSATSELTLDLRI